MRRSIFISTLVFLASAAPASAAVPHTVQPGETLWSIAAANNLTTRTVAAFNGLSEDSQVVLGQTIQVPTTVEGYSALVNAGLAPADPTQAAPTTAPAAPAPDGSGAEGTTATTVTAPVSSSAPVPQGSYKVRPGDTLGEIAATGHVSRNTVRTQVRGVLEKTGCSRQAEVIALLGGISVSRC